jgi:hypothetical protein
LKTEIFCEDAFSVVCDLRSLPVPGILLSHSPRFNLSFRELQAHYLAVGIAFAIPRTFTTRLTYCNALGFKMLGVLRGNSSGVSGTSTFPTPSGSSQFKQDNTHSVSGLAGLSTPSVEVSLHPPGCLRLLGELFLSRTW